MESVLIMKQQIECMKRNQQDFYDKFYNFYMNQVFKAYKEGNNVSFDMLAEIPVGATLETYSPGGLNIVSIKQPNIASNALELKTTFDSEAVLPKHFHDDCMEAVSVDEGGPFLVHLFCKKTGEVVKKKLHKDGAILKISKGIEHQFSNLGKTKGYLTVKFLKDE